MRTPNALTLGSMLSRALFAPLAFLSLIVGCNSAAKTTASSTPAKPTHTAPAIRSVETFDAVWTTVRDTHFDKTMNGVDWNAVRDELRPYAIAAASQDEARAIQLDMLSRLGQSHFMILPRESAERSPTIESPEEQIAAPTEIAARASTIIIDESQSAAVTETTSTTTASSTRGVCGIDIAIVEDEPTVLRVAANLGGAKAGVCAGWTLVSVEGLDAADALRPIRDALALETDMDSQHARSLRMELAGTGQSLLQGNTGQSRTAVFEDAMGTEHKVTIAFEDAPYGSTKFGNLPPLPVEVDSRLIELPQTDTKPVRIGVISFNIWMTAASPAIDLAVDTYRSCDGIVLDLRGNPGGLGAMSMGVAGHFLNEPASLGSMIARDTTLEFKASPRKVSTEGKRVRPYAKPLAIIVDGRSASTSEVFAGGLQDLGRARVFGETSAGMALPAVAIELPSGDVLMHAVADFVTSNGTRIEGRGIVPNEVVAPTRAALCNGHDPAIDSAAQWIVQSTLLTRAAKRAKADAGVEAVTAPISLPSAP